MMNSKYIISYNNPDKKLSAELATSIMAKALSGNLTTISELILNKNTNLLFVNEKDKKTITHIILENTILTNNDKYKLIKSLIIRGAPIDFPDENNIRPLHLACKQQNEKLIKLLCKKGADVNSRDNSFRMPLHYAVVPEFSKCPKKRKINKDDDQNNILEQITDDIYDMYFNYMKNNNILKEHFKFIYNIFITEKKNKFKNDNLHKVYQLEAVKQNDPQLYTKKINDDRKIFIENVKTNIPSINDDIEIDINDDEAIKKSYNTDMDNIIIKLVGLQDKFNEHTESITNIYNSMGEYQRMNYGFMYLLDGVEYKKIAVGINNIFNVMTYNLNRVLFNDATNPVVLTLENIYDPTKDSTRYGDEYTFNRNISHLYNTDNTIIYNAIKTENYGTLDTKHSKYINIDTAFGGSPIKSTHATNFFTYYGYIIIHYLELIKQHNTKIKDEYTNLKRLMLDAKNRLDIKEIVYILVNLKRYIIEICLMLYYLNNIHTKYLNIFSDNLSDIKTKLLEVNKSVAKADNSNRVTICQYNYDDDKKNSIKLKQEQTGYYIDEDNNDSEWLIIVGYNKNKEPDSIHFASLIDRCKAYQTPLASPPVHLPNNVIRINSRLKFLQNNTIPYINNKPLLYVRYSGNGEECFYYVEKVFYLKDTVSDTIKHIQEDFTKYINDMYSTIKNLQKDLNKYIETFNIVSGLNYINSYNNLMNTSGLDYNKDIFNTLDIKTNFTQFEFPIQAPLPETFKEFESFVTDDITTGDIYNPANSQILQDYFDYAPQVMPQPPNVYYKKNIIIHNVGGVPASENPTEGIIINDTFLGKYSVNYNDNKIENVADQYEILYADYVLNYYFKFFKMMGITYICESTDINNSDENKTIQSAIKKQYNIDDTDDIKNIIKYIGIQNINNIINGILNNLLEIVFSMNPKNTDISLFDSIFKNLFDKEKFRDKKNDITDNILTELTKGFNKKNIRNQGLQYFIDPFGLPEDSDKEGTRLISFDKFDIGEDDDKCFDMNVNIIPLLIKYGANPNGKERFGETPLTLAIYLQNEDIIKTLLELGANVIYKNNNILKNTYESCLYQLNTIIENSPSMSLDDIDDRVKKEIEIKGNIESNFIYSKYVLKMAMYLFNHQLTQYSDNYPYMWTHDEHKSLMEMLNIESKNINLPFGKTDERFNNVLEDNSFVRGDIVEKYNIKIHRYNELKLRLENALRNIDLETNVNSDYKIILEEHKKTLDVDIKRVNKKIKKYNEDKLSIEDKKFNKIAKLYNKYNKNTHLQNSICNYYETFLKQLNTNKNNDIKNKDISEYSLYIQAWKNILDRQETDVTDYTQLVSNLNRYILKQENMNHDIFIGIYKPVVSFYDKVLDKYGRDYFELSEYYNEKMKDYYGHNYALTHIMCIMKHVVKHTLCLDFVRTVTNKLIRLLINKGKNDIVKRLYDTLKKFYKECFSYIPNKIVKVVCKIYESYTDPDKNLTVKEILDKVFTYISMEKHIPIADSELNTLKSEIITLFDTYMTAYIAEMHKSLILQLKSFSVQSRLLKICMLLAEKATVETRSIIHLQ